MSVRILALDTATEACSAALLNGQESDARFEIAPRDHTAAHFAAGRRAAAGSATGTHRTRCAGLWSRARQFYGRAYRDWYCPGLALGAALPMAGISTLATLAQGAWRQHGACRVLTAIDARMGEVYWAEYQRDEDGIWQGEATESVLTPEAALERMQALSGEWYTAGTGWQAWPVLQQGHALQLKDSGVLLPAAEDMLPPGGARLSTGANRVARTG